MESVPARDAIGTAIATKCGIALLGAMILCVISSAARAAEPLVDARQDPKCKVRFTPAVYSSSNFVVHTDLPADEAEALLERLEATLRTISNYWRRPLRGTIQCYVARDIDRWPDSALPHPQARVLLSRIGGAMIAKQVAKPRDTSYQATVFALATPGIAEHETVHAYCWQTFGTLGPDWYKEGMAEMAYFGRHGGAELQCPQPLIDQLRKGPHRSPREVIDRKLTDSVVKALAATAAGDATGQASDDLWTPAHMEAVKTVKQSYLWSWALCHMLANNPNYAARFRALGRSYVTGQNASFDDLFGAMDRELGFEYRFMVDRMAPGFRADLCRWNWSKRFEKPRGRERFSVRIAAARGYQATGLRVTAGEDYTYQAIGAWSTGGDRPAADANGGPQGQGRLVAVIERDHRLTPPFELGRRGRFVAPADGKLHLRCRDDWGRLADNSGIIRVVFQRAASAATAKDSSTGNVSTAAGGGR